MTRGRRASAFARLWWMVPLIVVAAALFLAGPVAAGGGGPAQQVNADPTGQVQTYSTSGAIDTSGPFFQQLGTNGRTCGACHAQAEGWTVTPAGVQARFDATQGTDPIFRTNDGANAPNADVSTPAARRQAYSMLLAKGVVRIGLPIPAGAQFALTAVDDPYGYASAGELSLFRRPLPATNLTFLSGVMWDGRETVQPLLTTNSAAQNQSALQADLMHQAVDATTGHAQAIGTPTAAQQQQIVAFETALLTAQVEDSAAGDLDASGATGGPHGLAGQAFSIGVNDPLGGNPTPTPFDDQAMTPYGPWSGLAGTDPTSLARGSVARGEGVFNTRTFTVTGVAGLSDQPGLGTVTATCTTCHDTPNVGNHSIAVPLSIGVADGARRTPDLPLYTLTCTAGPDAGTVYQTTDPGRALLTGQCQDIGKFKGPTLRGLAARAPYFHNGAAATLPDVLASYVARFGVPLSAQDQADLLNLLNSL
jgi:cytochrome c peroxidase